MKEEFRNIYLTNYWRDHESKSGVGSTLLYTESLRKGLGELFSKFKIKSVLDAPCGDFNWMKVVLDNNSNIEKYIGGDIVQELIEDNKKKYEKDNVTFIEIDITKETLPEADIMICRDCLFHLPMKMIWEFLDNFTRSEIPLLLTTSHVNRDGKIKNECVGVVGCFNFLDLFSSPYNFPHDYLYSIDDWIEGYPERKMYLWTKEQIKRVVKNI